VGESGAWKEERDIKKSSNDAKEQVDLLDTDEEEEGEGDDTQKNLLVFWSWNCLVLMASSTDLSQQVRWSYEAFGSENAVVPLYNRNDGSDVNFS
jgi:hypothetical protein